MTTLNLQVAASADDAQEDDVGDTDNNNTSVVCDDPDELIGMRWAVAIAQGSTINSAALSVYLSDISVDEFAHECYAQASDNAASFTHGSENFNISARTRASATAVHVGRRA